jgi:dipeptidyl aminopeptidase/acylaminoacyl peptidase
VDKDTIKQVCWVGDEYVQGPICGVILAFHGLGFTGRKTEPTSIELAWAQAGGLIVFPYYGPWSWMNRLARGFVYDLVESVYAAYGLDAATPLISTGGSMGGMSSLIYTRYARRPVAACVAACPVCDFKYHFSERPDLPATIHHAFLGYEGDLESFFAENSPICQVEHMPDIPYLLIHGDKDLAVNKGVHSDLFVAAMRKCGRSVEYIQVPGMGHGGPVPLAVMQRQAEWPVRFLRQG